MDLNKKNIILHLIAENKDTLFGKFSEKLTHDQKVNKWKEITAQAVALGIFTKDWKYMRDTTWQNWRKRTIEKRDNRLQTGSGGGRKYQFDDSDNIILEIVGKDSPVLEGLDIPESSGSNNSQLPTITTQDTYQIKTSPPQTVPKRKIRRMSVTDVDILEDLKDLKKQKMEIEVKLTQEKLEIAQRERYKLDLELLKLERELNILRPSQYTLPFYLQDVDIADCPQNKDNTIVTGEDMFI